jgi:SagB-type dehydrogenase family enzyme
MTNDAPVDDGKRELMAGLLAAGMLAVPARALRAQGGAPGGDDSLSLPAASLAGPMPPMPLEQALQRRRSQRGFRAEPLSLVEVAQLLWAAQGRTDDSGHRTAPSAGALYPLGLTLVAGRVDGLAPGVYRYRPDEHALRRAGAGDRRAELAATTRGQGWIAEAPVLLVITADMRRTAQRYGGRAERFVAIEAGAVVQNVYLQATARALATVVVGAFDEPRVQVALALPQEQVPLALMPVGPVGPAGPARPARPVEPAR